jgi:2-hydroxy-3-keto-5-methylthiopentenyl-1-phosphate phosphatase
VCVARRCRCGRGTMLWLTYEFMLIIIDFDGTLATCDTVDTLLSLYADPAWNEVETQWLDGRITAIECMQRQLDMVRVKRATLDAFFSAIRLDLHFEAFWQRVRAVAKVAIVSDGLDRAIQRAIDGKGFADLPVFANQLRWVGEQGIALDFPLRRLDCAGGNGVCKCAVARRLVAIHAGPIILIGDGKSDVCLAGRADFVFAKAALLRHCQQEGIAHAPFSDFSDILRVWEDINSTFNALATA